MDFYDYWASGFVAASVMAVIFPVHTAMILAAAALIGNLCPKIFWRKNEQ